MLELLKLKYKILNDPIKEIKHYDNRQNTKDWIYYASWAVFSLTKYNKIDKDLLIELCFDHIIDSLKYNDKFLLASYIFSNDRKDILSEKLYKNY